MPAVLRWHDFEFRGHILWCDFCTLADSCQCGICGSWDSQWIRVMPWFWNRFFFSASDGNPFSQLRWRRRRKHFLWIVLSSSALPGFLLGVFQGILMCFCVFLFLRQASRRQEQLRNYSSQYIQSLNRYWLDVHVIRFPSMLLWSLCHPDFNHTYKILRLHWRHILYETDIGDATPSPGSATLGPWCTEEVQRWPEDCWYTIWTHRWRHHGRRWIGGDGMEMSHSKPSKHDPPHSQAINICAMPAEHFLRWALPTRSQSFSAHGQHLGC